MSAFPCHLLIDPCRFHRKWVFRDDEHYAEAQNVTTYCFVRQTGSASVLLPVIDWFVLFLRKGVSRDAKHYGEALNVVTSCFLLAKQEVQAFSYLYLIDLCRFFRTAQISLLSIYCQNCLASKTGSDDILGSTLVFSNYNQQRLYILISCYPPLLTSRQA